MLQVAVAKEPTTRATEESGVKSTSFVSQECSLLSSDGGSGGLERFSCKKLASVSGQGLERILWKQICPGSLSYWMKVW